MKPKILFIVIIGVLIFAGCGDKAQKEADSKISESKPEKTTSQPKQVIKKDPEFALKEKREEYRTTAYDSRLLPDPNSNREITRVPINTRLKVLEKRTVQQGRLRNNWYKVNYNDQIGWISGWNMKEGEELVITSVEEMERNYAKQIGEKPKNSPLTGKIDIVVKWLNKNAHDPKSIEYIQWYEPYLLEGCWNCRVEFRAKNAFGSYVKEDKIFKVKNSSIIEIVDKY